MTASDTASRYTETTRAASGSFTDLIKVARTYREKFLAHLDQDNTMYPPKMNAMWEAVRFYHDHVLQNEMAQEGRDRALREARAGGHPADIGDYYVASLAEGGANWRKAKST